MILEHSVSARRPKALITLGAVWAALLGAWLFLDAAWWVLAPLALATLPALFEAGRNDTVWLRLDQDALRWHTRRQSGQVPLSRIARVRFDTRLDLALNARLHLRDGGVVRLPVECVPPYPAFCAALDTVGIPHERHHFGLF